MRRQEVPPIFFYIPQIEEVFNTLPARANDYWFGFGGSITSGVYAWTLQTYLRLKENDFPCDLTGVLPNSGIILAHRASLPFYLRPNSKTLLVCLQADYSPHPYAQLHVVLNMNKASEKLSRYYMPHWPQAGIIPRAPERGLKFENIAFFGIEKNLAPELQSPTWSKQLAAMGLNWKVVSKDRWNDFSDVDVVIAIRSFDDRDYKDKPATKLYNAWCAGIPAILGAESAYQAERKSDLDYFEARSIDDVINTLRLLRDNNELRQQVVENGYRRAKSIAPESTTRRWQQFLTDVAVPEYKSWCKVSQVTQKIYLARCYLKVIENNLAPNSNYPHDQDIQEMDQIGFLDWILISGIRLYRKLNDLMRGWLSA
jgi:hypothetical protein